MGIISSVVKFVAIAALTRGIVGKIQSIAAKEGEKAALTPQISEEGMRNALLRVRRAQDEMRAALASFEEELKGYEGQFSDKPRGLYGEGAVVKVLGAFTYVNAEYLLKAINAPEGASVDSVYSAGEFVKPNMGIYQFPSLPETDIHTVKCMTGPGTFRIVPITVEDLLHQV